MPTYEFLNKNTGDIEEHIMSYKVYDAFVKKNKHLERYISSPPLHSYSGVGDFVGKKTDNTWKEVQAKIAEQNPRSPFAEQHLKKSAKRVKTDEVLKKHKFLG